MTEQAELPSYVHPDVWLDENHAVEFTTYAGETEPTGGILWHRVEPKETSATPGWCAGGFSWKQSPTYAPHAVWQLVRLNPLHIEPSIRCGCGMHGFIRDGKWVEA